jgi:hypothetical protein
MSKSETTPCPIVAAVSADLADRAALGLRKYGVTLGRSDLTRADWLQHAYEEALDMACYLRRLIQMETNPNAE